MPNDIALAILFGGLAMLAQYLPAKYGVPVGLLAVALSIWQLGWVGWPLWLGVVLLSLVAYRLFARHGLLEKQGHANKETAQALHNRIMELDALLEKTKRGLSKDEEWQQNPEIRNTLDKLQTDLNNLGYLVNSSDFDRWAEAMMSLHSKELHFHITDNDMWSEWGRARINAKLRKFVNKVKG